MKKVMALVVLFALIAVIGVCEEGINSSNNLPDTNQTKVEEEWLYEDEHISFRFAKGLQVYFGYLELTLEVENRAEISIGLNPIKVKINGWDVDAYCSDEISPNGKRRCRLQIEIEQAGITDYKEIETIETSFEFYRPDNNVTLLEIGPYEITLG